MKKAPSATSEPHPKIRFATQYLNACSTLNAGAALARCEALLADVEEAKKWMALYKETGEWSPWFGLEIFSYYKVGFVTCLEWHARSRLVDTLRFKPSAIGTDDIRGAINDKLLSEMVAAGTDIPGLVGASRLVNSADTYFAIFSRVFDELNIKSPPNEIGNDLQSFSQTHPRSALNELFEARHSLIHEISTGEIGPWIARVNEDLTNIEQTGTLVLTLIQRIEREISLHSPKGFPNKLTLDGIPFDEIEYLDQEIARLEKMISDSLDDDPDFATASRTDWVNEVEAYNRSKAASMEFIASCDIAGQRYFDFKTEMLAGLRKDRLQHLKRVAENIVDSPVPPE